MINTQQQSVYIFWDNSNLYIPAQDVRTSKEGPLQSKSIRLHFENLYELARAGRTVKNSLAVGSVPPDQKGLWSQLEKSTGIKVELYERGQFSGSEQGVDQCLQTHMLRALADEDNPQIVVLLTGDGKGYQDGVGFHADMERMQKRGWGIEVLSWEHSCGAQLKAWAQRVGVFVRLDDYYASITFLDGTRQVKPLSLVRRTKANATPLKPIITEARLLAETKRAEDAEKQLAVIRAKEDRKKKYNKKMARRDATSQSR